MSNSLMRLVAVLAAIALPLLSAGCAGVLPNGPARAQLLQASADSPDPLEKTNRSTLRANKFFNDIAISPVAHGYQKIIPQIVRARVNAAAGNLGEPRIFANDILQLRLDAASDTFGRFVVNSTLGLGGLFDVATRLGLPKQTGDFGQTLYVWGFNSGPYIVMPVFGPSTVRDGVGFVVDTITDPASQVLAPAIGVWPVIGIQTAGHLENVELLDDLEAGSPDEYARLRSVYLQQRASELGEAIGVKVEPQIVTEADQ